MFARHCFAFSRLIEFSCLVVFCGWIIEFSNGDQYFVESWGPNTDKAEVMQECNEKCKDLVDELSENPVRTHISNSSPGQDKVTYYTFSSPECESEKVGQSDSDESNEDTEYQACCYAVRTIDTVTEGCQCD